MDMDISNPLPDISRERLERLKVSKARLSREMAEARQTGAATDGLAEELRQVSSEVKRIQKELKRQLNAARTETKWAPGPVEAPVAIGNKNTCGNLHIRVEDGNNTSVLEAYVANHPGASVWHRPCVIDFIRVTCGHRVRYFCAWDQDDNLVGVLPVVQLQSRFFGNFLVAMPYFNYGGVLADNREVAFSLITEADKWRDSVNASHLELRFWQNNEFGLPQKSDKVSFWLPLPDSSDELWSSFQPKVRAQIRRGEREMTELVIGEGELLDEFYRVFSINMRDLGTPVYGKPFFENLLRTLQGSAWLVVARIKGQAVGCAFLTGHQTRMEIPWASTLRQVNHTSINMIMYWKILGFSISQGFKIFDFGRCSYNAGTYRFKQQWGGSPIPLYWDYLLPEGQELPKLNPNNPKFALMIAVWKRLPVNVANFIGPHVVKGLP